MNRDNENNLARKGIEISSPEVFLKKQREIKLSKSLAISKKLFT